MKLHTLLEEGNRVFGLIVNGDREQIERFIDILDCLAERKEAKVENFLLTCFSQYNKVISLKPAKKAYMSGSYISGADLVTRLVELLSAGSLKALKTVLAKRKVVPPRALTDMVSNAWRVWPREKVYREFAPLLRHKSGVGEEKGEAVDTAFFFTRPRVWPGLPDLEHNVNLTAWKSWDPRWLDAAIKADRRDLVCLLARPHHAEAIKYLLKAVDLREPYDAGRTIAGLSLCRYPQVTDFYFYLVDKSIKKRREGFKYQVYFLVEMAKHLPRADLPRLEAFKTRLPERLLKEFEAAIAPLRRATNRLKSV